METEANKAVVVLLKAHAVPEVLDNGEVRVFLTRKNLEVLLSKLDANKAVPGTSACTLIKNDNRHPKYPQTHPVIVVKALEDEEYYTDRAQGLKIKFARFDD
jgi:hypothetical protein